MIKYSLFTVYLLVVNIQDRLIVVVHHKEGRDLTQQKGHCVGFVGANSVIPTGYDVVAHHLWTTSYPLQQTLSKDSSSPTNWGESPDAAGLDHVFGDLLSAMGRRSCLASKRLFSFFYCFLKTVSSSWHHEFWYLPCFLRSKPHSSLLLCTVRMYTRALLWEKTQFHAFLVHRNGDNDETIV